MFGKTPDKQASPGLSGQQARQREEQACRGKKTGGRGGSQGCSCQAWGGQSSGPREAEERQATRTKTRWKTVPGLRKKRAEVSAAGKLSLVQELKKMETATGSKAAAKQHLRRPVHCRSDDSQARGQAGLAIRGEQSQAGSQAGSYGSARKQKRSESQAVRDNQGQPFGERVKDNLLGNPPKETQPFGEASFWGSNLLGKSFFEEPTFLKVGLEAC